MYDTLARLFFYVLLARTDVYISDGRQSLHLLLSFAVGSLIGDVFLHLLPTIWADTQGYSYFLFTAVIMEVIL